MIKTAFISGHVDISVEEFKTHYLSKIDEAIDAGHNFITGSARGADRMALEYLHQKCVSIDRIMCYVYEKDLVKHQQRLAEIHKLGFLTYDDFTSYTSRDASMTEKSDYDIAWVRPVEECKKLYGENYRERKSGTQLNLERRVKKTV